MLRRGEGGDVKSGCGCPSLSPDDIPQQTAWTLEADSDIDPDRADRRAPVRLDDTSPPWVRVCARHCS